MATKVHFPNPRPFASVKPKTSFPAEARPSEVKPSEARPSEARPSEVKLSLTHPAAGDAAARQLRRMEGRLRVLRLKSEILGGDSSGLEKLFGVLKPVYGLWLIAPTHVFATAPHLYRFLSPLPEWVWGLAYLLSGTGQALAWYYDNKRARFLMSGLGTMLWLTYGILIWLGDHRSPSLVFLTVLALFQGLAAYWLLPRLGNAAERTTAAERSPETKQSPETN